MCFELNIQLFPFSHFLRNLRDSQLIIVLIRKLVGVRANPLVYLFARSLFLKGDLYDVTSLTYVPESVRSHFHLFTLCRQHWPTIMYKYQINANGRSKLISHRWFVFFSLFAAMAALAAVYEQWRCSIGNLWGRAKDLLICVAYLYQTILFPVCHCGFSNVKKRFPFFKADAVPLPISGFFTKQARKLIVFLPFSRRVIYDLGGVNSRINFS